MASSSSSGTQSSQSTSRSTSTPVVIQTPQSLRSLALSQALEALGNQTYQWAQGEYSKASALTDQQINNFLQYASAPRLLHEMGRAEAGSRQATQAGMANAERQLQSFGIDPSSGRYQDLIAAQNTAAGAAAAAAGETARQRVEDTGMQLRQQALADKYALANAGSNLMRTPQGYFDAATRMINPVTGQNTQSESQSTSQGQQSSFGTSPSPQQPSRNAGPGAGPGPNFGPTTPTPGYNPMGGPINPGPGGNYTTGYNPNPIIGQLNPNPGAYDPMGQNDWADPYNVQNVYDANNWGQGWPTYQDTGVWGADTGQAWYDPGTFTQNDPGYGYTGDLTTPDANWGDVGGYDTGVNYDQDYEEGFAGGGVVPAGMSPSGGQQVDDVQAVIPQTGGRAVLNANEFVIPRDVAMWKGQEFFQNLIKKSREARMGAPAKPKFRGAPQ